MTTHQAELEKELFRACEAGDVDRASRVIAAGVDPKKVIDKHGIFQGETPLHAACRYVIYSASEAKFPLGSWLHLRGFPNF